MGAQVVGGPAALVASLRSACDAAGVSFRLESQVEAILTRAGRVEGVRLSGGEEVVSSAVLSTVCPHTTLLGLLGRRHLRDADAQAVSNIRMRGTTAKAEIALSGTLVDESGQLVERYQSGASLDALERAFDAAKYGDMSTEPLLDVRAFQGEGVSPPDHSTLSVLVHFAPYNRRGGWTDAAREELGSRVLDELERAFPGSRSRVVGLDILSPVDIEEQYRLRNGHVFHGEHAPDQLLFMRPTINMAGYTTPVEGLFMGGSGNHPGGGITCGAGYLAAKRMLA